MKEASNLQRGLDHNILIFSCVFPRLGSHGPLSSARSVGSGTSAGSVNSGSSARPAQEPSGAKNLKKLTILMLRTYVSARDRLFRVGETRVGVTKYAFLSIKVPRHPPCGETVGVFTKAVRTPTPQALFGEQFCIAYLGSGGT